MDKIEIRKYHNHSVILYFADKDKDKYYGFIIKDEGNYCLFVSNLNKENYLKTKDEKYVEKIPVSSILKIDYQIK